MTVSDRMTSSFPARTHTHTLTDNTNKKTHTHTHTHTITHCSVEVLGDAASNSLTQELKTLHEVKENNQNEVNSVR